MCRNRALCIAIEVLLIARQPNTNQIQMRYAASVWGHLMEEPYELRARASTGPAPAGE
jgi:hypothetical protein